MINAIQVSKKKSLLSLSLQAPQDEKYQINRKIEKGITTYLESMGVQLMTQVCKQDIYFDRVCRDEYSEDALSTMPSYGIQLNRKGSLCMEKSKLLVKRLIYVAQVELQEGKGFYILFQFFKVIQLDQMFSRRQVLHNSNPNQF